MEGTIQTDKQGQHTTQVSSEQCNQTQPINVTRDCYKQCVTIRMQQEALSHERLRACGMIHLMMSRIEWHRVQVQISDACNANHT